jgi:DNA-binding MarR family transcriptional regulator
MFKLRKIPEELAFIFVLIYITKNPRANISDIVLDLHLDIGLTKKILESLQKMNFIEVKEK